MNPLSWIDKKVLEGALAASLLANIFLFWGYSNQVEDKTECVQATQVVTKAATEKKIIIERRQNNVTNETEAGLRAELERVRRSVLNRQSRQLDLPRTADASAIIDGNSTGTFLLSDDELACNAAVVKAVGWQDWYVKQVKIREEQNAANTEDDSVSSPRGRASAGSVPRQRERVDVGLGSNESIGAPSLPTVLEQHAKY